MPGLDPSFDYDALCEHIGREYPEANFAPGPSRSNQKPRVVYPAPETYPIFVDASAQLRARITDISANPPGEPYVFRATPGLGKTQAGLHMAWMEAIARKKACLSEATREMAHQAAERMRSAEYGVPVIVLEGRHAGYVRTRMTDSGQLETIPVRPNCNNFAAVERAAKKGYSAGAYVCPRCRYWPHRKNKDGSQVGYGGACAYYQRFIEAGRFWPKDRPDPDIEPVVVCTHAAARAHVIEGSIEMDTLIIDEDPSSALRTTQVWSRSELERAIQTVAPLKAQRHLLAELIQIASAVHERLTGNYKQRQKVALPLSHLSKEELAKLQGEMSGARYLNQYCLSGRVLAHYLKVAADAIGQTDLVTVLAQAAEAKQWIDKGGLFDADEDEVEDLPHHLEPVLAHELLKVLLEAKDDQETCYSVSVRFTKDSGWNVFYDKLEPIGFAGQLVLLDAYADDELTRRYLGRGKPPTTVDARCRCRDNVRVEHYKVKTTRKVLDDEERRTALYDEYIWPHLEKLRGKRVLFYTAKRYVEWLRDRVQSEAIDFEATAFKYWWMDRGDDSFGDYDAVIVFGTPIPNIVAERNGANATFAGEEPLSWSSNKEGLVDKRVKAYEEARREKELLQAVYRLRPASPGGKDQLIVLVTDMKLPVALEMPGVEEVKYPEPSIDEGLLGDGEWWILERLECWSTAFTPFLRGYEDQFVEWGAAVLDGEEPELWMPYDELIDRYRRLMAQERYRELRDDLIDALGPPDAFVRSRAGRTPLWGNIEAGIKLLRALQVATRQPGEDFGEDLLVLEGPDEESAPEAATSPPSNVVPLRTAPRGPPDQSP